MFSLGSSPPYGARPASLAARRYVAEHLDDTACGAVIAVSGGADSTALALAFADQLGRTRVPFALALVDHRMREGSAEEAQRVKARLERIGVGEVAVLRASPWDGPPREAPARELRHRLLERYALAWGRSQGLSRVDILYGHTMDDQAETVLMRLGRGASAKGLSGIRPRSLVEGDGMDLSVYRAHPFLGLRRSDTEGFCHSVGVAWVNDPSNSWEGAWTSAHGRPLPRNGLRHRVLPELKDSLHQDPVPALARVAQLLADDDDALQERARAVFLALVEECPEGICLPVAQLSEEHVAVRRRVYIIAWERTQGRQAPALSAVQVEAVDGLVTEAPSGPRSPIGKKLELPGGGQVVRRAGALVFLPDRDADGPSQGRLTAGRNPLTR